MSTKFSLFGASHIIMLILGFLTVYLAFLANKIKNQGLKKFIAQYIGWSYVGILIVYNYYYWFVVKTWSINWQLPLQICSMVQISISATALSKSKFWYRLAYFWGLGAFPIAFLTPDLRDNFPHPFFFQFWTPHILGVFSLAFILFYKKFEIFYRDVWIAFASLVIYIFGIVYPINILTGSNYVYLIKKPDATTIFNLFGPLAQEPYHLIPSAVLILFVLHLIFWVTKSIQSKTNLNNS